MSSQPICKSCQGGKSNDMPIAPVCKSCEGGKRSNHKHSSSKDKSHVEEDYYTKYYLNAQKEVKKPSQFSYAYKGSSQNNRNSRRDRH